jgi:hypothetical protein
MFHHLNSGQNQDIRIANELFENLASFKDLGMTLTNQNDIHDEIKSRLNSGNVCYYSVENLLSSCLISRSLKIKIYKTVILLFVLYGCETWSLTLREKCRLRIFENRVLRRMFGPKREEDGLWRKLHTDEVHSQYSSLNIVRVNRLRRTRWTGHLAYMGEGRGVQRILVGRPKHKRPLGRHRHRWEDNNKLDLREVGIDGANWIQVAQVRVHWWAFVKMVMILQVL